jgi:hypothetical protein
MCDVVGDDVGVGFWGVPRGRERKREHSSLSLSFVVANAIDNQYFVIYTLASSLQTRSSATFLKPYA